MGSSPMRITIGNHAKYLYFTWFIVFNQQTYQLKKRDYFLKFDAKRVSFEYPLILT